ncbi:MAG: PAS domain S-box protein, partial [Chloroflexia bacterium]|nr:PAS domain S-box protein [Chloroflexia bacterium]
LQLYTLLSIGLGLALISTVQSGLVGIGRIHLLFTVILASLLLEPRHAVPFTVLAVTLVAGTLAGMAVGLVPIPSDIPVRVVSIDELLLNALVVVIYAVLIGNTIGWLINRLSRSLRETATALAERDRLNSQLELLVEARTEELRRSQALLQTLLDNSPAAVYVKSSDGHYLLTNAFTQQALNLSQAELEGKRDLDLFGDRALPWRAQEQEAIARGQPIEREVEHMQDGTLHTYYVTKFPIYDETGAVMAVGGIAYDMTTRKLAEERLAVQLRVQLAIARCARQLLRANVDDSQHEALLMRVFDEFYQATDLYHIGLYAMRTINGIPAYKAVFQLPDPTTINDGTPLAEVNPVFLARLLRGEPVGGPAEKIFIPGSPKHAFWQRRKIAGIAATLITVEGRPWGFVGFGFAEPYRPLETEELALLSAMAEMVGAFLSRLEANRMLRQRLDGLAALNQIAQSLMSWIDLPMALRTVGRALMPLFEANRIAIWLCEEQTDNLVALAVIGDTDALSSGHVVPMNALPPAQMVLASLNDTVTTEPACALLLGPDDGTAPSTGTYLIQPLVARKRGFGLFVIHAPLERTTFGTNERELAQIIAGMLSSAIENARLYQDTMVRTAQEERRRLARELHDSITQSLYSMTLLARAWTMTVHDATDEDLTNWFRQIEEISLQSLKEMRLLIYQLRSPQLDQQGLAEALRLRLEAVEERTGIKVDLDADRYQHIRS